MIRLLFFAVKNIFYNFYKRLYWFFRLTKSDLGSQLKIHFPIKVEGSGKLKIDSYGYLGKNSKFILGDNSEMVVGNKSFFEDSVTFILDKNCKLTVGDGFKIGAESRLFIKNDWKFGNNVKIETYTSIFARESESCGRLHIGDGSNIGDYTIIDTVNDVIIGNDVAIGPNCTLYTHDHKYDDKSLPSWKGGLVSKPIKIADGAWVGANVTLLPGVQIGERAVIASSSVVTKNVEANSIYGGVPAKLIKRI
ncbi:acyltransferase [Winogradskyella flava]|uniref:acyltransferase n=1 Tax=Winogradskyella flava TaxID=1884876 RepID=UPI00249176AB|nr:acyltransferase [Winogradskyella flava]